MNSATATQIILGLILIVGAIVSAYGIPLLKSAFGTFESNKMYQFILKAVEWANQTIPAEEWERKKTEVMQKCINYAKNNVNISFTDEEIEVIVEAFVTEVKNTKEKAKRVSK